MGRVTFAARLLPPAGLTALTEAAAALNSTLELEAVLSTIAELARAVTHAEASTVFSLDVRRNRLTAVAATGHWRDALIGREFEATTGIPGCVLRTGECVMLSDARKHAHFDREIDEISSTRTRTLLAVPMMQRSNVVGVIEVVNRRDDRAFLDDDLHMLVLFATFAASAIHNARTHRELKEQVAALRESAMPRTTMIGQSSLHRRVLELCQRVAGSGTTVLLLGETGTGKEVTARHIHELSRRREESFIAVNCAAVPENLLESELFGHEKGSFTGAHMQRRGWFELAERGTLFLDEIGDISRPMQAKLLRVLQDRQFMRVGGSQSIACDTRLIAATNRNLKNMVIDGLFRDDLYYRLSVFPISLPPLRERREDVPLFVEHFVRAAARDCNIRRLHVDPRTVEALAAYSWPGNIRELQNVIERSVLMSDGEVLLPCHLPPEVEGTIDERSSGQGVETLHGQERALIVKALEQHQWNQSQAAKALGITRYHVRHRMKKYQIERPLNGDNRREPEASDPRDGLRG